VSHAEFRDRLIALAGATAQDPGGYLEGLSDIHDDWHTVFGRGYGFLLFHNRVVRNFKAIVGPAVSPAIQPFTNQDFQAMGVQPFQPNLAGVDTLGELVTFSTRSRAGTTPPTWGSPRRPARR
jgi:hypothetical protein